jgi:hypothetical protein
MIRRLFSFGIVLVTSCSLYAQERKIPDAHLEVTIQQKEDGKLARGFHLLELSCWDGQCSLQVLTLNQCIQLSDETAFYPKVQHWSTQDRNLTVHNEGNTLVVEVRGSDVGGDYVTSYRFEYDPPAKGTPATRLVGFSGAFVKNSIVLKKVITVEYVPLPKASQIVTLDCGVMLPGVDKK